MAGDQHSDGMAGGAAGGGRTLADRSAVAGVSDRAGPWDAWLQLRAAEGNRATVIDLYELVAADDGRAKMSDAALLIQLWQRIRWFCASCSVTSVTMPGRGERGKPPSWRE